MKANHIIITLIIICIILVIGIGYLGANRESPAAIKPVSVDNAAPADSPDETSVQKSDESSPKQVKQSESKQTDNIELCPHGHDARYCMYDDGSYAEGGGRDIDYEPSPYDDEYLNVETTVC